MKVPSQRYDFANGIACEPHLIPAAVWSEHVVKHVLGINWDRAPAAWNVEGWDALTPPVVTEAERAAALGALARLTLYEGKCGVNEVHGKPRGREAGPMPCRRCPARLAEACCSVLDEKHSVGSRYAGVAHQLLDAVMDARLAARPALLTALQRCFSRDRAALENLVVMSVGAAKNAPDGRRCVARLTRGDGVTCEFMLVRPRVAQWRTLHRTRLSGANSRLSFLCSMAPPLADSLSENCLVPRLWWESHGA